MNNSKVVFITGITGQDGAYLSRYLLEKKIKVVGAVRENDDFSKLEYLKIKDKVVLVKFDLLNFSEVSNFIKQYKPCQIYNFAAQSSVVLSFTQPFDTLNFNINSVINLLESIRVINKDIRFFQASSCEVFGKAINLPVTKNSSVDPLNPYAVSKVSADLIVKNYRKLFNLFACCGLLFNHESYLRDDKFFIKKILKQAVEIKNGKRDFLRVGNIDVKRDFGYAPDYVENMWNVMQLDSPDDYIFSSGASIFLKDIIHYIFDKLNISKEKIIIENALFRPTEIKETLGDNSALKSVLSKKYKGQSFYQTLDILIGEEVENICL